MRVRRASLPSPGAARRRIPCTKGADPGSRHRIEGVIERELRSEIEGLGAELRQSLTAVLSALAGVPPRPTHVTRVTGLDKSLASRFVRATQTASDLELMHVVPSPEGIRILAELSDRHVEPALLERLRAAADRFQGLVDSTPGGRAALDAQIAEGSSSVRERSEQAARQAAFKSMSFLLGQFCETLVTTLFLVPSKDGRMVDGIEIHRRIGLRRIRPSTPLALMSMYYTTEDDRPGESVAFEPIDGGAAGPLSCLLPEYSSAPLPEFQIIREGCVSTLVLAGDPQLQAPARLSSAFRITNAWKPQPAEAVHNLRGYVLHLPCQNLVREIHVAEGLYPGATPRVSFVLPGPRGSTPPPDGEDPRHYASVHVNTTIEPLPDDPQPRPLRGVPDQPEVIRHVLARSGHAATRFRGWRCAIRYPVPMVEMIWWLVHPGSGC